MSTSQLTSSTTFPDISSTSISGGGISTSGSAHHVSKIITIALPTILVASAVAVTAYFCKAWKKRHHRSSYISTARISGWREPSCNPERHGTDLGARTELLAEGHHCKSLRSVPTPSVSASTELTMISALAPTSLERVSMQGCSIRALDGTSSMLSSDAPQAPSQASHLPMEKITRESSTELPPQASTSHIHLHQEGDLCRPDPDAIISPAVSPLIDQQVTTRPSLPHRSPIVALPVTPRIDPAHAERVPVESYHSTTDVRGHDRVVVLPWPLGERLLAFLANTPQQHGPGEGASSMNEGSEILPAYSPR